MSKRPSMKKQVLDRLSSMKAFGESKHLDKKRNKGKPAKSKIYSHRTMRDYKRIGVEFAEWSKKYGCRTLEEARPLVAQYLQERIDAKLSPWTINKDASALVKLYQIERFELGVKLPRRNREDIKLHRFKTWEKQFSEKNNHDLVELCQTTGLRREEIGDLRTGDVWRDSDGRVIVHVRHGKGGKERFTEALTDAPLRLAEEAKAEGREYVVGHIQSHAPIHQYRAQYAKEMYDRIARDPATLSRKELYCARKERLGQRYDREALRVVSENLGHTRVDILMNYLR